MSRRACERNDNSDSMTSGLPIGILDFGSAGNVKSVANAFKRAGVKARLIRSYSPQMGLSGLVMPGVGSFSVVPGIIRSLGGKERAASIKIPVLCICLGMQALFPKSEECRKAKGLGIIEGKVRRIRGLVQLPQLGWNQVYQARKDALFFGIKNGEYFYFANSYAAFPSNGSNTLASTEYGERFASTVRYENWYGVQFHPEKSGRAGLKLIKNFAAICRRRVK